MNLENCRYFIAAAEELNFTQAAKKLHITQQALSKQIDKMEKLYNTRLFEREPSVRLTAAGECIYRHMCRILDDERQMIQELDSIIDAGQQRLTIGVSYYRSSVLLPRILSRFYEEHPEVLVTIRESNLSKAAEELRLGKVNLLLGYENKKDQSLMAKTILEECVILALPRTLARAYFSEEQLREMQERKTVSLKEFVHCPFIRLTSYTWLGKHFDNCCEQEGLTPHIVLDSSSVLTVLNCCLEGIGAVLIPSLYLKGITEEQLRGLYLFRWDYPNARCDAAVLYLKNMYLSEAAKDFIRIAQSTCAQLTKEQDAYLNEMR